MKSLPPWYRDDEHTRVRFEGRGTWSGQVVKNSQVNVVTRRRCQLSRRLLPDYCVSLRVVENTGTGQCATKREGVHSKAATVSSSSRAAARQREVWMPERGVTQSGLADGLV